MKTQTDREKHDFETYGDAMGYLEYETDQAGVHGLIHNEKNDLNEDRIYSGYPIEDARVVWNEDRDRGAAIVSDDYKLTQHQEFLIPTLKAIREVVPDVGGITIRDAGERVDVEVVPQKNGFSFEPDQEVGDIVSVGMRASNSFDKSIRETLRPFAYRLVCTNGMIFRETLGSRSRYHRGDYDSEELLEDASHLLENALETVPHLVSESLEERIRAREITLDEDSIPVCRAIVQAAGFGSQYTEDILDRYEGKGSAAQFRSLWQLYNAATYVVENVRDDVAETIREDKHVQAERILTGDAVGSLVARTDQNPEDLVVTSNRERYLQA